MLFEFTLGLREVNYDIRFAPHRFWAHLNLFVLHLTTLNIAEAQNLSSDTYANVWCCRFYVQSLFFWQCVWDRGWCSVSKRNFAFRGPWMEKVLLQKWTQGHDLQNARLLRQPWRIAVLLVVQWAMENRIIISCAPNIIYYKQWLIVW